MTDQTLYKGQDKVYPLTCNKDTGGRADAGGYSAPRRGRISSGKDTRYALYMRLGEPRGLSRRVCIMSPPSGFRPWTIHHVASCYTD